MWLCRPRLSRRSFGDVLPRSTEEVTVCVYIRWTDERLWEVIAFADSLFLFDSDSSIMWLVVILFFGLATEKSLGCRLLSKKTLAILEGITTRGIYRVSAVKSKVEELCHQFERDQEGTSLADYPPQVIANTLKLYFRQLPEVCGANGQRVQVTCCLNGLTLLRSAVLLPIPVE